MCDVCGGGETVEGGSGAVEIDGTGAGDVGVVIEGAASDVDDAGLVCFYGGCVV